MNSHAPPGSTTIEDVRQAIEALSNTDLIRLRKAARLCLAGTEYTDAEELMNEAVLRTMRASHGEKGRHWPKNVAFMAFLIQTMKGLANDSLHSNYVTRTQGIETLATERLTAEEGLGAAGQAQLDIVVLAIEAGERAIELKRTQDDVTKIDAFFACDEGVGWLLMGHKDGLPAAQIRDISGMSQTEYETARKRLRRGLEKMFPGRSSK